MKKEFRLVRLASAAVLLAAGLSSCGKKDQNSPGVEFMPDMYRSPSLEYYQTHTIDGDTAYNAMKPVAGTVARGFMPYPYPNTAEGYEKAGAELRNPLAADKREQWEAEGERLYGLYCVQCHGATGMGDGKVGGKLPGPPPAYSTLKITEGNMFHTLTYGKGLMGAHNSILSAEERWKLVYFVQKLQGPPKGADSTKAAAGTPPAAVQGTTAGKS